MLQPESLTKQENKSITFLKKLRDTTSERHMQLESNDLLSSLVSPQVTIHQYYCYLLLMQSIYLAYQEIISDPIKEILHGWVDRKSGRIIEDDLTVLNYLSPNLEKFINYKLPIDPHNKGFLLGFMYVIEGSRLGGKVIYKNIHRHLRLAETGGAKYLADYGHNTSSLWRTFITQLADYSVDKNIESDTITGAIETFASINDFFESNRKFYEL